MPLGPVLSRGRRWSAVVLVVLLTVLVAGLAAPQAVEPAVAAENAPAADVEPLEPVAVEWLSDRMVDVTFDSPRLDPPLAQTTVRVLVPPGYDASLREYPLLLLLHGAGDRYDGWTTKQDGWPTTLEEWSADADVVIAMPDGGTPDEPGWYTDWHRGGEYGAPEWETYHIGQLLPWLADAFRIREDRAGITVAGLSMGGGGAMHYAARHPDTFGAAFGFSGAMDTTALAVAFPDVWGDPVLDAVRVQGHSPTRLAANLHQTRVWFRTNRGLPGGPSPADDDPAGLALEGVVAGLNDQFDAALTAAGVEHDYLSVPQGGHNWWHWHDGLQTHAWAEISAVHRGQADVPAALGPFDHVTIDTAFSVGGWDFAIDRTGDALTELGGVSTAGFTASGSGTLAVATPPDLPAGATYAVTTGGETTEVTVGEDRRLRFDVLLGLVPTEVGIAQVATAPPAVDRLAGVDRYETAVTIARDGHPDGAAVVVLARGDAFADGLAGAPVAASLDAPLLLTGRDAMPAVTVAELARLAPERVVVLGGQSAVADAALAGLPDGVEVTRVAGPDRHATAAAAARAIGLRDGTAVIASGETFADVLTASTLAARTGAPILLTGRDELPAPTAAALADLGVTRAVVVGGPAAVSDGVLEELTAGGFAPERVAGPTRYGTAAAVAAQLVADGASSATTWIATGADWPDALAAGAAVAAAGDVLLLTDPEAPAARSPEVVAALAEGGSPVARLRVLGGTAAVAETAVAALVDAAVRASGVDG
ncbi:cell wall-binding repeat-containing protein [Euzebya sp.]|uniref:cell wall-binding repeat-containing protein n=1 Tax=Euzebya sp. TaxID=1971409 RepID=UPI003519B22B